MVMIVRVSQIVEGAVCNAEEIADIVCLSNKLLPVSIIALANQRIRNGTREIYVGDTLFDCCPWSLHRLLVAYIRYG